MAEPFMVGTFFFYGGTEMTYTNNDNNFPYTNEEDVEESIETFISPTIISTEGEIALNTHSTAVVPNGSAVVVNFKNNLYKDLSQCTLYVPTGSMEAYQNEEGWKEFGNIVEIESNENILLGDANHDDIVSASDIAIIEAYLNNKEMVTTFDTLAADANQDGKIDNDDVKAIVEHILLGSALEK